MNIDVAALKGLVREKDVSFDTVVEAIESAGDAIDRDNAGVELAEHRKVLGR